MVIAGLQIAIPTICLFFTKSWNRSFRPGSRLQLSTWFSLKVGIDCLVPDRDYDYLLDYHKKLESIIPPRITITTINVVFTKSWSRSPRPGSRFQLSSCFSQKVGIDHSTPDHDYNYQRDSAKKLNHDVYSAKRSSFTVLIPADRAHAKGPRIRAGHVRSFHNPGSRKLPVIFFHCPGSRRLPVFSFHIHGAHNAPLIIL